MKKTVVLMLLVVLSIGTSACSVFDKKPCPPITICPPAPVPTPCPEPPPVPEPTPCPECPPEKVCPPEVVCPPEKVCPPLPPPCPPEKVCPPVVKCPEGIAYPEQTATSPCWLYAPNNILNYYMLNREAQFKACLEQNYALLPVVAGGPVIPSPIAKPHCTVEMDAMLLWDTDPKCPSGVGDVFSLPPRTKAECIQRATSRAVASILVTREILPGKNSPCWGYAPNNEVASSIPDRATKYDKCLKDNFDVIPALGFGRNGHYLKGMIGSTPWEGCAAGISGNPIRVSLAEPKRVEPLIAWETANYYFWRVMDRIDLADGNLVGQATNRAISDCSLTERAITEPAYTFDSLIKVQPK